MMANRERDRQRAFLKDTLRLQIDFSRTDQNRGMAPPPLQKPPREGQSLLPLPGRESFESLRGIDLVDAINERRHAFETYPLVGNVESLAAGVYRYLPVDHALVFEHAADNLPAALARATLGQAFVAAAPVTLAWTAIPYRMEWRYDLAAHRVIAMDAGHLCQNLYLACAAIGAGTCAVAAYDQERMDALLGVDGEDEFTVYLAPVGKINA